MSEIKAIKAETKEKNIDIQRNTRYNRSNDGAEDLGVVRFLFHTGGSAL